MNKVSSAPQQDAVSGHRPAHSASHRLPPNGYQRISALSTAVGIVLGWTASHHGHAARISEPDTILYGRVVERLGSREFPVTQGLLVWNLRVSGPSGRDVRLETRLESLSDGRFSYRLRIPHELLAYDLTVRPKAVGLTTTSTPVQHLSVTLDGRPLNISPGAVDGFSLAQSRRAGTQRVDLELGGASTDTDGDGAPDWWEDQRGLDKYDPTDSSESAPGGPDPTIPSGNGIHTIIRTFADWRAAWFPNAAGDLNAFGQEDIDKDGISNFLEYAFDLDPRQADSTIGSNLPMPFQAAGRLGLAFRRRNGATDLVYHVETSADLFQWENAAEALEALSGTTNDPSRTILADRNPTTSPQRFFRVRVERQ
ncbi:MAG: hypothetical protein JNK85_17265 [Verrucomicrobiales bacterium]|nr:hypothetical protein [Verrucomicrobiales bacterium]